MTHTRAMIDGEATLIAQLGLGDFLDRRKQRSREKPYVLVIVVRLAYFCSRRVIVKTTPVGIAPDDLRYQSPVNC